jgi:hypothetical protein
LDIVPQTRKKEEILDFKDNSASNLLNRWDRVNREITFFSLNLYNSDLSTVTIDAVDNCVLSAIAKEGLGDETEDLGLLEVEDDKVI